MVDTTPLNVFAEETKGAPSLLRRSVRRIAQHVPWMRINRQAGNRYSETAALDEKIDTINTRLDALDQRLAGFDAWFGALNGKLDSLHATMHGLTGQVQHQVDRSLLLQGRIAGQQLAQRDKIRDLGDVEFRVYSQWGEDGITEWLCQKLPGMPRSFVEFGVESFSEANCRFLLENRGWRGLVMDASHSYMEGLRREALYWRRDLTAAPAFITPENINKLITENGFAGEIGILSVDIDGNDYWVLDAIECVKPAIIICEINSVFGDLRAVTVPYLPDFDRMKAHYSGQYFGCSVGALKSLCTRKGYRFIGTSTSGVNAFFVRNDLAEPILSSIADIRIWPAGHRDSRNRAGELDFTRGMGRFELIKEMPVVDLESGKTLPLRDLQPLYSERFLQDFC